MVTDTFCRVKRIDPRATMPSKGSYHAAGWDLYTIEGGTVFVDETRPFATGITLELPETFCGLVLPRSGLACKRGLTVANSPGLIDSDYRGEVLVYLHNESNVPQVVQEGERVAQLLISWVPKVDLVETDDDLTETARGTAGFGSTGRR